MPIEFHVPHTPRPWRATICLVATLAGSLLVACSDDQDSKQSAADQLNDAFELVSEARMTALEQTTQYVGTLDDDANIYVGVEVMGSSVRVYVCNGDDIGAWYVGSIESGALTASQAEGETLVATLTEGVVTGTVNLAGDEHPFTAEVATLPAGLYELAVIQSGEPMAAATVVLPDGTARGLFKERRALKDSCMALRNAYNQNYDTMMHLETSDPDYATVQASMTWQRNQWDSRGCNKFDSTGI